MKAHGLNPRIRKSPYFTSSLKYGASEFHPYNGMWMPVGYDTPVNEYWNTIERATMWDVAVQRCVEISGPDAEVFTNLLTPRDVSKVAVGQCRYLVMTNQEGGILNDPVMLRIAADRFWLSTADADMYLWAKGVATYSGHDVRIGTPDVYPLQVQGPRSPDIVAAVFGDAILDLAYYRWMPRSTASTWSFHAPASAPKSASRFTCRATTAATNSGKSSWPPGSRSDSRPVRRTAFAASRAAFSISAPT